MKTTSEICLGTILALCFFHPIWVFGRSKGLWHNLLMQFSTPGSSKMQISETDFFDIVTIHNDQISYVKQVLAPVFYPIWVFAWGASE